MLFQFTPDVDLANLDRHIGYFTQGGLGLTDPTYYTRADPDTQALPGRSKDYVEKILVLTGTPADKAAAQAQKVNDIETRHANATRTEETQPETHTLMPTSHAAHCLT